MTAILFVCLGNICRSPLAEGVFRLQVKRAERTAEFEIDSAGCSGWHEGELPDHRAIAVAARHSIDLSVQRARKIQTIDFLRYDLILGLDRDNVKHLNDMRPDNAHARVALYLEAALGINEDVPDPYYGGAADFEAVYKLCQKAGMGLLKSVANV